MDSRPGTNEWRTFIIYTYTQTYTDTSDTDVEYLRNVINAF